MSAKVRQNFQEVVFWKCSFAVKDKTTDKTLDQPYTWIDKKIEELIGYNYKCKVIIKLK